MIGRVLMVIGVNLMTRFETIDILNNLVTSGHLTQKSKKSCVYYAVNTINSTQIRCNPRYLCVRHYFTDNKIGHRRSYFNMHHYYIHSLVFADNILLINDTIAIKL